jgi:hypothetical protein
MVTFKRIRRAGNHGRDVDHRGLDDRLAVLYLPRPS